MPSTMHGTQVIIIKSCLHPKTLTKEDVGLRFADVIRENFEDVSLDMVTVLL